MRRKKKSLTFKRVKRRISWDDKRRGWVQASYDKDYIMREAKKQLKRKDSNAPKELVVYSMPLSKVDRALGRHARREYVIVRKK